MSFLEMDNLDGGGKGSQSGGMLDGGEEHFFTGGIAVKFYLAVVFGLIVTGLFIAGTLIGSAMLVAWSCKAIYVRIRYGRSIYAIADSEEATNAQMGKGPLWAIKKV